MGGGEAVNAKDRQCQGRKKIKRDIRGLFSSELGYSKLAKEKRDGMFEELRRLRGRDAEREMGRERGMEGWKVCACVCERGTDLGLDQVPGNRVRSCKGATSHTGGGEYLEQRHGRSQIRGGVVLRRAAVAPKLRAIPAITM
jgi:hypothetical protein